MSRAWHRWVAGPWGLPVLFVACCWLAACRTQSAGNKTVEAARPMAELTAGPLLAGNDQRAWLSSSGGTADTNYCAARIRTKLEPEAAWSWEYSAGSFSQLWVAGISHYEGRVYVTAYSPNLACLDAGSGAEIFNSYLNPVPATAKPPGPRSGNEMMLGGQFMHGAGQLLLLRGQSGEQLIYDLGSLPPALAWDGPQLQMDTGYLLANSGSCIGSSDAMVYSPFDGSPGWEQLTLDVPVGNVLSTDGILFTRDSGRSLWANRLSDGRLLWSLTDSADLTGICVDDAAACLYVTYEDERVDALALEDGSLLWSHNFGYLLDGVSRADLVELTNARLGLSEDTGYRQALMDRISMLVIPDGLVIVSEFGKVLCLDKQGVPRWQREDLQPVSMALAFENAILLQEYWYPLELAGPPLYTRLTALPVGEAPDWEQLAASLGRIEEQTAQVLALRELTSENEIRVAKAAINSEFSEEEEKLKILYTRLELLGVEDGESLGGLELPNWIRNALCPAQDKLVFENTPYAIEYYLNQAPPAKRLVQAYNWLEPEGDA